MNRISEVINDHLHGDHYSGRRWFNKWFRERVINLPHKNGTWKPYRIAHINTEHGKFKPKIKRCLIQLVDKREFWVSFDRSERNDELYVLCFNTKEPVKSYWIKPIKSPE